MNILLKTVRNQYSRIFSPKLANRGKHKETYGEMGENVGNCH